MEMNQIGPTTAWRLLIAPHRTNYSLDDLGPKLTSFASNDALREDFKITNKRGCSLAVSLFFPIQKGSKVTGLTRTLNRPCVIYCHSQQGCRVEGVFLLEFCIENGIGLCLFDFAGCGKSQGDFVTLGWHEADDVGQLVDLLTTSYRATQIVLWGRSMGAVAAIMYAERNSMFLSAMVLDSPFSDISDMVEDVASDRLKVPKFVAQLALKLMSSQIESRVHFDILKLKPAAFARSCSVPCVFVIGKHDRLVFPKRALEIFEAYLSRQKTLVYSNGDHSSEREPHVLKQCYAFVVSEVGKHLHNNRPTVEPKHNFVDRLTDNRLASLAVQFEKTVVGPISSKRVPVNYSRNSYNFDFYIDEVRNEEQMARHDEPFDEYGVGERLRAVNSDKSMSLMFKREDVSTNDLSDVTKEDIQIYVKELSKGIRHYY